MSEQSKSSINWGGLAKGLLAGGAIIAGLVLVAPTQMSGIWESITKIGTETAKTGGTDNPPVEVVENWITKSFMPAISSGIGSFLTKVGGIALAITGLTYLMSPKKENNAQQHAERYNENKEAFTLREDMRRMQETMKLRMGSAGVEAPVRT